MDEQELLLMPLDDDLFPKESEENDKECGNILTTIR